MLFDNVEQDFNRKIELSAGDVKSFCQVKSCLVGTTGAGGSWALVTLLRAISPVPEVGRIFGTRAHLVGWRMQQVASMLGRVGPAQAVPRVPVDEHDPQRQPDGA